jgi:hypothetical protein
MKTFSTKQHTFLLVAIISGALLISNTSCKREGCTNPNATNYDSKAKTDDGSCIIPGCTNPNAANYDSDANRDDGSCIIYGCTDPDATNYNPQATDDDGSCVYPYGEAVFWTDDDYEIGQISVYVNNFYEGKIIGYWNIVPACGAEYCVTIERDAGTYPFYAIADDDTYWEGSITINPNDCSTMRLYVDKNNLTKTFQEQHVNELNTGKARQFK